MTMTARGVIARVPGEPTTVEEFTIDDPGSDEVLVRILASGVCHTDYGIKSGTYGTSGFPFLLGHEGAGVVEAVGPGVERLQVGAHVMVAWRGPWCEGPLFLGGKTRFFAYRPIPRKRKRPLYGKTRQPVPRH